MDCPECGRELEVLGEADLGIYDEDAMEYYCGMCEQHHIYDHFIDEWVEEDD